MEMSVVVVASAMAAAVVVASAMAVAVAEACAVAKVATTKPLVQPTSKAATC